MTTTPLDEHIGHPTSPLTFMGNDPPQPTDKLVGITLQGGYEHEFVNTVEDEYKCLICLDVMREPQQIFPCGHCCCKSCLQALLRKQGDGASCPIDRQRISNTCIFTDNNLKRKILNMKIKCDQANAGCCWQAELLKYEDHVSSCQYVSAACRNEGCTYIVLRKQMPDHEAECKWRLVLCSLCGDKIRAFEGEEHRRNDCPEERIPCENRCSMNVPRSQMLQHIESECAKTVVQCPARSIGCTTQGPRERMDDHLQESSSVHFQAICNELENIKSQLASVKADLDKVMQLKTQGQSLQSIVPQSSSINIWQTPIAFGNGGPLQLESSPFATGPRGYCFQVVMLKRPYESIFSIRMIPGVYDDLLPWPFKCDFSIIILDQQANGPRHHIEKHVDFCEFSSDSVVPPCYHRPHSSDSVPFVYPLLIVKNKTLCKSRYFAKGQVFIMVKVKSYNCEENLGL